MRSRRSFRSATAVLLIGGLAIALLPATSASAASPPVGDWRMEEGSGTVLVDSSASANNGTILGDPTWVVGQHGLALRLDGVGTPPDRATVPDSASLDISSAITMATWVRPERTGAATQNLIKKAVTAGTLVGGYELSLAATQKVFVRFNQATVADGLRLNSTTSYPLNGAAWMHVAATYDGTTMRLYINGVQEAFQTSSFAITTNNLALGIGAQPDGASLFLGALDDTLVYNSALTAAEVAALAGITPPNTPPTLNPIGNKNAQVGTQLAFTATASDPDAGTTLTYSLANGTGGSVPAGATIGSSSGSFTWTPTAGQVGMATFDVCVSDGTASDCETISVLVTAGGLVGDWKANEGSGTTLVDSSGLANNGTILGNPTWVTGQHGQAIRFDGMGDYATVADNASLDISGAITMATWVKPEITTTQYLIKKAIQGGTDGYELSLATTGFPFVRFNSTASGTTYRVDSPTAYPNNGTTWMHLAATSDGITIRLYVNGTEVATKPAPAAITTNNVALGIGGQSDGVSPLRGAMDDTLLYNRALSASEVAALATITPTNTPPTLDPIGNKNAEAGTELAFTATASDPNVGDTLTFSLVNGTSGQVPAGASITSGGAFTWTPTAGQVGPHTFDVCVSDGTESDCETITVTVAAAPTPGPLKDDFDGDGRSDLLWRHSVSGEDYLWFMNGTQIGTHGPTDTLADQDWKVSGVGDFNGDAKADIVWRNTATDRVDVWLMDGTTVLASAPVFTLSDPNWKIVGTGDFDGDGSSDILWRNAATGENYLWFMQGTTLASSGGTLTLSDLDWKVVGTADFNGDAKADIAWRNAATGQVYVWLMDGAAITSSGSVFTLADPNWQVAGTGDFNGNGRSDLLWRNSVTGEVYVWFMNGTAIASSASVFTLADQAWQIAGTGDYDGNDKADIVWRNASTGEVYVWLMDGATIASHGSTFVLSDLDWQIVPSNPPAGQLFAPAVGGSTQTMTYTTSVRGAPALKEPARIHRWWQRAKGQGPRTSTPTPGEMTWTVKRG